MNIVVPFKVVPDDQDIVVASDGSLDFSKAKPVVSAYDLNAIEAAAQLADDGSRVTAITVGALSVDDSKLKKSVLARGVDELFMMADDACADLDAYATAAELAKLMQRAGDWDIVVCGDGSADLYAQQVDVQLAARLGVSYVSAAQRIDPKGSFVVVERLLETEIETVEVPLPAVVSVAPDIAMPRICGMKDILAAGKKPANVSVAAVDVAAPVVEVLVQKAPRQAERRLEVYEASVDGAIDQFAAAVKAAL